MLGGALIGTPAWAAGAALGLVWTAEWAAPLVVRRGAGVPHTLRNLAMGAGAGLARGVGLTGVLTWATLRAEHEGAGLLRPLDGTLAAWGLAFLILDLWNYLFHVLCHKEPLLWRLHAVHHSDSAPDATTAVRFHFAEVLIAGLGYLIVLPLAGITMPQLLFYETVLIVTSLFHHGSIRLPARADRVLGWIIVTPGMHLVHHSRWVGQTDSNYAPVLSIWDRLFETTRRGDPARMEYGLDGYPEREHATVWGLLMMPVSSSRSRPGRPPRGARGQVPYPTGDGAAGTGSIGADGNAAAGGPYPRP